MSRYIVFDVETPNAQNNRMSSIGITVVENGRLSKTFCTYVNPETYFNTFNIQLTKITPQDVMTSPNFPQLWKKIEPVMNSGILVAHNAIFDMKVLAKCLHDYGIESERYRKYMCTVQMGRKCFPELENHKLDTLCSHLNISLDHHKADSDSKACAKLLITYMRNGLNAENFVRTYDFKQQKTVKM
ncbi:MAG: 3'-5' exonuclease [Clostridia bacterium]|nr:3'-5' exonuclease [Clostridia bacterium]